MSIETCLCCGDFTDTDYFPEIYRIGFKYIPPKRIKLDKKVIGFDCFKTIEPASVIFTGSEKDFPAICDCCFEGMVSEELHELWHDTEHGYVSLKEAKKRHVK